jgi:hypothetical protein
MALVLAACGDDANDDAGGGSSQPLTTDQAQTAPEEDATTSTTETEDGAPKSDGGKEQDAPERAPSLAEFIKGADPICKSAQADIARQSAEYRDLTGKLAQGKIERQEYLRRASELTERSGEIAQRAVADLEELALPTSRREAIDAYLQGARTQAEIVTAQGKALREGRTKEIANLNRQIAQASQDTRSAAQRVGFRVCGGG